MPEVVIPEALTPEGFAAAQTEALQSKITVYPARSWAPSQIGHACDRFLVYRFSRWQDQQPHDWVLQSVFDEGNLHAPDTYRRLEEMGFMLIRESDRPRQWKVGAKAVISGRIDGKLIGFRGEKFQQPAILEIKSMQAHQWNRVERFSDLLESDSPYVRAYADQGYSYLMLEETPMGVFVLKNKATGLLKVLPYELDYQRGEWLLQRIERLQAALDAGDDVPPITFDPKVCGRCPFRHVCYPAKDMGQGLQVLEDAQLLEDLETREKLKDSAKEYAAADKAVKDRLKRLGEFEMAAVGNWFIKVSKRNVKEYTVKARTDTVFDIELATKALPPDGRKRIGG